MRLKIQEKNSDIGKSTAFIERLLFVSEEGITFSRLFPVNPAFTNDLSKEWSKPYIFGISSKTCRNIKDMKEISQNNYCFICFCLLQWLIILTF